MTQTSHCGTSIFYTTHKYLSVTKESTQVPASRTPSICEVQGNLCPPEAYGPMMGAGAGVQIRVSGRPPGALTGAMQKDWRGGSCKQNEQVRGVRA